MLLSRRRPDTLTKLDSLGRAVAMGLVEDSTGSDNDDGFNLDLARAKSDPACDAVAAGLVKWCLQIRPDTFRERVIV